ncbi:helix-turn-helix domain-containing protein [Desulforamulus reducens]|uniref:helix-turn-helix domain-containing protein n=1 Tax=Desulforamulus reducens TaxID=59610 RepID=UPI00059E0962
MLAKHELTQEQLAQQLGFTRGQVSNYEQGSREPDFETLKKIADFFKVTTDYMLGRTDDPTPVDKLIELSALAGQQKFDPMKELPPEAQRSLEDFIDYLMRKYKKDH